jgi:hypothetical protein
MKRSTRIAIILAFAVLAAAATLLFLPPIAQPQEYHGFADSRAFLGIPNFLDFISGIPFVLIGVFGLWRLLSGGFAFLEQRERIPWVCFFAGALLTGFGSAFYHWAPSNETLLWDRLPMTLIAAGLLAAVVSERIGVAVALRWLAPFVLAGLASVLYWFWQDDLRPYGLVQFLPIVLIPLLILLFPPRYTATGGYFAALGFYVLAKIAELWDERIFAIGGIVSGHTIKHLLVAVALFALYRMLRRRETVPWLRPVSSESAGTRGKSRRRR